MEKYCDCCGNALYFWNVENKIMETSEKCLCGKCYSHFGVYVNLLRAKKHVAAIAQAKILAESLLEQADLKEKEWIREEINQLFQLRMKEFGLDDAEKEEILRAQRKESDAVGREKVRQAYFAQHRAEFSKVLRVVDIVVHQGTYAFRSGLRTIQSSFRLRPNDRDALIEFMVKHGFQPEEAVCYIGQLKQKRARIAWKYVARTNKVYPHGELNMGVIGTLVGFLLLSNGCMVMFGGAPPWMMALISLWLLGLVWISWDPQFDDMNKTWRQEAPQQEKLEKMLEICQGSRIAYIYHHKKAAFIALAAVVALFVFVPAGISAVEGVGKIRYHMSITADGRPLEMIHSTGSKFVIYDTNKRGYLFYDYLPEEYRAESADDVAGVLKVTTETKKVDIYGAGVDGYKYYVTITLYDCAAGEDFDSILLEGGDPPKYRRSGRRRTSRYGSKPSDEEMENAILHLIEKYQAEHQKR